MIAFGPVPSRRLGRSLGINNIPPKVCTYSCVYCQLGRTPAMQIERIPCYSTSSVLRDVTDKVEKAKQTAEPIDYLAFVPDGEPSLDVNLGGEISLLKPLGIKIAVVTNASLLWKCEVREDLQSADWVSLKVDSTEEGVWQRINRPHKALNLDEILGGVERFAESYEGELVTETMLVAEINDHEQHLRSVADFLSKLELSTAYVSIPTRPPAEKWVQPPTESRVNGAYQILSEKMARVECMIGYEGNAFAFTGDVRNALLDIISVHPMREDAVKYFLKCADADWSVVQKLIEEEQLEESEHLGKKFYTRHAAEGQRSRKSNEVGAT